jgi:C4-dicarboxylate-specific signal transduction histidine kinase
MERHTAEHATDALSERAGALHDLAHLVDAALRCAGAARRANDAGRDARAQWGGVEAALEQIADLVPLLGWGRSPGVRTAPTVRDAVGQAGELMRPAASEQGVQLVVAAGADAGSLRVPGLLRVLTDAVRNSLESIALAACSGNGPASGRVEIRAGMTGEGMVITVRDDGAGPPAALSGPSGERGWGLTVAQQIVRRSRGTLALLPAGSGTPGRPGAVLKIVFPVAPTSAAAEVQA